MRLGGPALCKAPFQWFCLSNRRAQGPCTCPTTHWILGCHWTFHDISSVRSQTKLRYKKKPVKLMYLGHYYIHNQCKKGHGYNPDCLARRDSSWEWPIREKFHEPRKISPWWSTFVVSTTLASRLGRVPCLDGGGFTLIILFQFGREKTSRNFL